MNPRLDGVIAGLAFRATVDGALLGHPELAGGAFRALGPAPAAALDDAIHAIVVAGRALERQRRDPEEDGDARRHAKRLERWRRENPRPWIDGYAAFCGEDKRPGFFYVSVTNGTERRLLRGPFVTHREAMEALPATREEAQRVDPRACWYAFGTARAEVDLGPGVL